MSCDEKSICIPLSNKICNSVVYEFYRRCKVQTSTILEISLYFFQTSDLPRVKSSKCFVLNTLCFKTKHLRRLVWDLVRGFECIEILDLTARCCMYLVIIYYIKNELNLFLKHWTICRIRKYITNGLALNSFCEFTPNKWLGNDSLMWFLAQFAPYSLSKLHLQYKGESKRVKHIIISYIRAIK